MCISFPCIHRGVTHSSPHYVLGTFLSILRTIRIIYSFLRNRCPLISLHNSSPTFLTITPEISTEIYNHYSPSTVQLIFTRHDGSLMFLATHSPINLLSTPLWFWNLSLISRNASRNSHWVSSPYCFLAAMRSYNSHTDTL